MILHTRLTNTNGLMPLTFEIEHTKPPNSPSTTYALDLMSKVLKHLEVAFCVYDKHHIERPLGQGLVMKRHKRGSHNGCQTASMMSVPCEQPVARDAVSES